MTEIATRSESRSIGALVQSMRGEISRALPKHMDADRMARVVLTAIRRNPQLAECTDVSFMGALLTCSQLGLEPNGPTGEAYLVPYKHKRGPQAGTTECQLIVGYQGWAKLFYQSPLAKHLDAQAVHEHDDFDYAYGLQPFLRHKPARGNRGRITEYYAVATLQTGASAFVVLTPDEVKALRKGKEGTSGDIADPQHWMERKVALRQALKLLPKSTELQRIFGADGSIRTDLEPQALDDLNHAPEIEAAPRVTAAEILNRPAAPTPDNPVVDVQDPPGGYDDTAWIGDQEALA